MIFGNPDTIAIELGEIDSSLDPGRNYIPIRFVLFGQRIGDWEYRIPLLVATGSMRTFLSCRAFRKDESLKDVDSESFFAKTYTAFYEYDYKRQPVLRPNLRDRYHLSEVAGTSICDKYGIVVADVAPGTSRIVVKEMRSSSIILDKYVESKAIEDMGRSFLDWGENEERNKER